MFWLIKLTICVYAGNITYVGYYNFSGNIDNLSVLETAITQQEVINYVNCPPVEMNLVWLDIGILRR